MAVATLYWTYDDLNAKIRRDLDLTEESFVTPTEMMGYVNEAIDRAEQEVHTLYEDYFLAKSSLSLVSGQEEYDLPDGIYCHKIRRVIYRQGSKIYKVHRIGDWRKFETYEIDRTASSANLLSYFLLNQTPGEPKILFTPVPRESTPSITIWYIRQANRIEAGADILDIPEANNYILQYVKVRCLEKEHNPMLQKAMADLEVEKQQLVSTLAAMIPDAENEIEADFTSYEELS